LSFCEPQTLAGPCGFRVLGLEILRSLAIVGFVKGLDGLAQNLASRRIMASREGIDPLPVTRAEHRTYHPAFVET